jgi:hypothetical protein
MQERSVVMRKKSRAAHIAATLVGAAVLAEPAVAQAVTPACSSFTNPVFISGAAVAKPLVQALAKALAASGSTISIIYQNPDSCLGLNDLIQNQPSTESGISVLELGPNGTTTTSCTLDSTNPQTPDIGMSDTYASVCGVTSTAGLTEVLGPIQSMSFAVPGGPTGSNATSISAEAAYVVFGYDATNYTVPQWNQPSSIFVREPTAGAQAMIGVAIGLSSSKWANAATVATSPQEVTTGTKMASTIAGVASNQNATIGVLATENVESWNAAAPAVPLKILAYQHTGQKCGYLPSSSQNALDAINVRQGRYAIWGPLHFFAHVDNSGNLTGPHAQAVATVLNYFIATGQNPDAALFPDGESIDAGSPDGGPTVSVANKQALIAAEATPGYVVPWCAMQVERTSEIGAEASYQSPEPCGCYFESVLGATVAGHSCTTCTTNAQCSGATPTCRYGFCEVQ